MTDIEREDADSMLDDQQIVCMNDNHEFWREYLQCFNNNLRNRSFDELHQKHDLERVLLVLIFIESEQDQMIKQISKVKELVTGCPIFIISNTMNSELLVSCIRQGVDDFCCLPHDHSYLIRRIRQVNKNQNQALSTEQATMNKRIGVNIKTMLRTKLAIDYIDANLDKKIYVHELALSCDMSPAMFARIFKDEHKITVQKFILRQRLSRAEYLLRFTDFSVKRVGIEVGFADLGNFSRVFKQYFSHPPSEIKKEYKQKVK
ncbi:MAG: AraC family transcriptional regulator [Gammaproteobacteria bacterium]|nr:AraC family transcriptional regulator [Gammaproteobacteria bacterium]